MSNRKAYRVSKESCFIFLVFCTLFTSCSDNKPTTLTESSDSFSLLTYNVAGLPQGISPSNPEKNIPLISPLLNKFDVALVQEDFFFHNELMAQAEHPYKSKPESGNSQILFGDGLNRFSMFPLSNFQRKAWQTCSNDRGNDCLALKGFSVAETEIAPGVTIDVYNLHMDSGGSQSDIDSRRMQIAQLLQTIKTRSAGKAVIVAGDTNLNTELRAADAEMLQSLLDGAALTDACRFLACSAEMVDRVLFRKSASLMLKATSWKIDPDFVDEEGNKLSDHFAVAVDFDWALR